MQCFITRKLRMIKLLSHELQFLEVHIHTLFQLNLGNYMQSEQYHFPQGIVLIMRLSVRNHSMTRLHFHMQSFFFPLVHRNSSIYSQVEDQSISWSWWICVEYLNVPIYLVLCTTSLIFLAEYRFWKSLCFDDAIVPELYVHEDTLYVKTSHISNKINVHTQKSRYSTLLTKSCVWTWE